MNDVNAFAIPSYALYGENLALPDVMHCETLVDRASVHDWVIRPHRHGALHQFFLIRHGGAQLRIDGAVIPVVPPALINVPRGAVHGFHFDRGSEGIVVTLPVANFPDLFDPAVPVQAEVGSALARAFVVPAGPQIQARMADLAAEFRASDVARLPMLRALAMQIACLALRARADRPQPPDAPSQHMARFASLVQAHFREGWRVADYAAALGMSRTHLNRVCRAAAGLTAQAYVEGIVIREACRMLAYTMIDIARIGYDLGFEDPSYFSRMFRRAVGVSPSTYRQRLSDRG